jgi:hypothetical protein
MRSAILAAGTKSRSYRFRSLAKRFCGSLDGGLCCIAGTLHDALPKLFGLLSQQLSLPTDELGLDVSEFLGLFHTNEPVSKVERIDDFASAWDVLAGVTASQLEPERAEAAKTAVRKTMWPNGDGWRRFCNETHFIIGHR